MKVSMNVWLILAFYLTNFYVETQNLASLFTIYQEGNMETKVVNYSVASEPWDRKYGNHRARISVEDEASAIWVHIPWRRRDNNPHQDKAVIVIDASTGEEIKNVVAVNVKREYGDLIFEPQTLPGEYYVYYLPSELSGWQHMPEGNYLKPAYKPDAKWLEDNRLNDEKLEEGKWKDLPKAQVIDIQAINDFHSFFPMEVIATEAEVQELLDSHKESDYLLFPEDRSFPIRMSDRLPVRWIEKGVDKTFHGEARPGEFFVFQIGVYACRKNIEELDVEFDELKSKSNSDIIPADAFRCFNLNGVDEFGNPFEKKFSVEKGKVRALWFGIQVPDNVTVGEYESKIKIIPQNLPVSEISLNIEVVEPVIEDAGDSEIWRHSRLRWLDSTLAIDDEVVEPYIPLKVDGNNIECLGRTVHIGDDGLPKSIHSKFAPDMTHLMEKEQELLKHPFSFIVETNEKKIEWQNCGIRITKQEPGAVSWESQSIGEPFTLQCKAQMEFDGYIEYNLTLTSDEDVDVSDIYLDFSMPKELAKYLMGMGCKGGYRPESLDWKWDAQNKQQDSLWIGNVNAGIQIKLKGENYSRPLINIYYHHKPLNLPYSWGNEGKGGCKVSEKDEDVFVRAYSRERVIKAGEKLHFDFTLLITPFKTIDTKKHWYQRYYHSYGPVEKATESGANIINIHHANETNPYINYPFLHTDKLKDYIQTAHKENMKVKIYYTVRELSNHVVEMWALRSLGDEIFVDGPGGGYSWLQEHLEKDYLRAWFDPNWNDAAIIVNPTSRWNNYYIEGLAWLLKNVEIDGIYIDDMSYGREVMKRVRKILDRLRPGSLIDFHSWNHFNDRAGFVNCANLYMENLPFVDRIWFGEGFDYNESPDYWLIEISGIPFGQMGEMLQGGGNPWRGMIYGMTARMPWSGNPEHIWRVCDEFGIQESEMYGYWTPKCPIQTNHKDILATLYKNPERSMVAIASWADQKVSCRLKIDWEAIGLDATKAKIIAPPIKDFQESTSFGVNDAIPIEPGRGWLLFIQSE